MIVTSEFWWTFSDSISGVTVYRWMSYESRWIHCPPLQRFFPSSADIDVVNYISRYVDYVTFKLIFFSSPHLCSMFTAAWYTLSWRIDIDSINYYMFGFFRPSSSLYICHSCQIIYFFEVIELIIFFSLNFFVLMGV